MANPSKQKGTAGETELVKRFRAEGFEARRTSPGMNYDVHVSPSPGYGMHVDALATRPDRGEWLVSVRLVDFIDLLNASTFGARLEVKRYKSFAHHGIFEKKFGRK